MGGQGIIAARHVHVNMILGTTSPIKITSYNKNTIWLFCHDTDDELTHSMHFLNLHLEEEDSSNKNWLDLWEYSIVDILTVKPGHWTLPISVVCV